MSPLHQSWKDEHAAPDAQTSAPTLPADVERCEGRIVTTRTAFGKVYTGQADCLHCLRRTTPRDIAHTYSFITPPAFVGGFCPQRIAP